jgi:penicillin-binding protein 2
VKKQAGKYQSHMGKEVRAALIKKIVFTAVVIFCLWGFAVFSGGTLAAGYAASPPGVAQTRHRRRRVIRHSRRRYRRRYWSPWNVSSYDDHPAAGDNPEGEDLAVRQAAIAALGNWNGSIVVVNPHTGRILTIVNQKLALGGAFRPCSTFKPIVALAALNRGIISPHTKLRVGRRWSIDLTDALAHSNNQFFFRLGEMVGFKTLAYYAHEFGLGHKAGWDIPGELSGEFPTSLPEDGVGNLAYLGEGIEVTPLQMAAVVSAIANGGTLYYLQYPRTPEQLEQFEPKVRRRLPGLATHIPEVRAGMAAAVKYGTARLANGSGTEILGKTGTCSEDGARLGWFDSYSAEHPKYVVVVFLRGGWPMYGPHAAEIAGRFYQGLRETGHPEIQASGEEPAGRTSQLP